MNDTGYKLLFSHPEMVRDLITGYIPGDWVREADFTTLERISASYVSESEKERHDDMVWRLRIRDRWLWVYLVLEFQSRPDSWMAVRMLVYLGLLAQDLIRRDDLHDGKLPPILPVVLYNGEPVWSAPTDVIDCFVQAPGGLQGYLPRLFYHLIDEARLQQHPSEPVRNFSDALFRLEHSRTPEDMRRVLQALDPLMRDEVTQPLRRAFAVWVKSLLRRKVPTPRINEVEQINDIMEADTMLAERIGNWFDEATRKGVEQGMQQGMQQGEVAILLRLIERKFGQAAAERHRATIEQADAETLLEWSDRILTAETPDAIFH